MLINIENLSFSYGINEIFNQLSLSIQEKEMIGLVGRNGSGKSTFLKLLAGQLTPDSGVISKKIQPDHRLSGPGSRFSRGHHAGRPLPLCL